ncbi:MAG TPA: hypothetical protein VIP11_23360 [Gemmatimonadaceae bacterium]
MRVRTLLGCSLAFSFYAFTSNAGAQVPGANTDGLIPGNYVRVSGGVVTPVNAQGSLKDWKQGTGLNFMYENWDSGPRGLSRFGFGVFGEIAFLPFDEEQFKVDFADGPFGAVRTASAGKARVIQFGLNTRFRIPVPYMTPSISLAFGFLDWNPADISYTSVTGANATAKQQHRQGAALTAIGGLDKHIFDRYAIFAEAVYTYGYTSFGQGLAAAGSACVTSNCDLLKNTPLGSIRGGIRARISR